MPLRSEFLWCLLLCSAHSLKAQEAKFIDLSTVEQRATLRVPESKEPNCGPEPCVVVRETSVADCSTARKLLRVAVDRIIPTRITLDPFGAEFRILNMGVTPIEVPISPQLSDLQPPGELQEFHYLSFALVVTLHSVGLPQATGVGWVELYGSGEHGETILELRPGQWIRVRANVKLHTWPSQPVDAFLRGDFWLHENVFKPEDRGGFIDSVDLCPNRVKLANSVDVHFTPTRSIPR
jgi:hypothetical protein